MILRLKYHPLSLCTMWNEMEQTLFKKNSVIYECPILKLTINANLRGGKRTVVLQIRIKDCTFAPVILNTYLLKQNFNGNKN